MGVDVIACVSVDSAAVMGAWRRSLAIPKGLVFFYADPEAALANLLTAAANTPGVGVHFRRFAAVIRDGVVELFAADPTDDVIEVRGATHLSGLARD
jgi:peroxiredoxin